MGETVSLKVFSASGIDALFSSITFKTHCFDADYAYTLMLLNGYVHKSAEAKVDKAVIKRKDYSLYYKHYTYADGTNCVAIYATYVTDKTLAECLKSFKVKFDCVVLFKVDSENDGIYIYKDKSLVNVKSFPVGSIDKFKNF